MKITNDHHRESIFNNFCYPEINQYIYSIWRIPQQKKIERYCDGGIAINSHDNL